MKALTVFQRFNGPLRSRGFRKTYDSRAGGERVSIWEKTVGTRKMDLQLWVDGNCRVSHAVGAGNRWRGTTPPSDFRTVAEMDTAIAHELERTDHEPLRSNP